jgi:hypothetical protein
MGAASKEGKMSHSNSKQKSSSKNHSVKTMGWTISEEEASAAVSKRETTTTPDGKSVEVLYQKMGNRWYTYYVIDEDVFVGKIPEEVIDGIANHSSKKPKGNA